MTYLGNPPVNGVFKKLDNISGSFNGSTTTFNLTSGGAATTPGLAQNLIISLGGVIQEPGSAFTINGSTVSFTSAPATNTTFWGIQLGDVGLATNPNQSAMTTQVFTATAGQTTFTVAGGYTAGQIQIFENGVQLVVGADVTASNGTTFVLTNAATVGDTLVAIVYSSFIVANAVAKSGDTMTGALTVPDLAYTGTLTGSTGVLNIGSGQLYKDSSGNVGIGTTTPNAASGYTNVTLNNTDGGIYDINVSGTLTSRWYANSTGAFLGSNTSVPLIFNTVGTERARIDSSGNLLVGTTSPPNGNSKIVGLQTSTTSWAGYFRNSNASAAYALGVDSQTGENIYLYYQGTYKGLVSTSAGGTTYGTVSDYRLKENIAPMQGALELVSQLKPCTYAWKEGGSAGQGFIAHELAEVVPQAVYGEKDEVNADGSIKPQGVDYSKIVVHLVAACQELKAQNDELKARITALEGAAP